ncbi:hypothetical protein [Fluviicola taffensis]|uniref:hypothetical protein n=1 Tax=Fluviicola taffensis TaxID=191579 RepID=UPI003137984E
MVFLDNNEEYIQVFAVWLLVDGFSFDFYVFKQDYANRDMRFLVGAYGLFTCIYH